MKTIALIFGVGRVIPNAPFAPTAIDVPLKSNRRVRDNAPYRSVT